MLEFLVLAINPVGWSYSHREKKSTSLSAIAFWAMSKCQNRNGKSSCKDNGQVECNCFERKLIELLLGPSFASLILPRVPIESAVMKNEAEEC